MSLTGTAGIICLRMPREKESCLKLRKSSTKLKDYVKQRDKQPQDSRTGPYSLIDKRGTHALNALLASASRESCPKPSGGGTQWKGTPHEQNRTVKQKKE